MSKFVRGETPMVFTDLEFEAIVKCLGGWPNSELPNGTIHRDLRAKFVAAAANATEGDQLMAVVKEEWVEEELNA